jgi:hypothetical protein
MDRRRALRTRFLGGFASVLLGVWGAAAGPDDSAETLFHRGLELYEAGKYEEAAQAFSNLLAQGVDDPAGHYNLANCLFKTGRLGPSIYHYRRAHALAPRDEDIAANLDYARFLALDALEDEAAATDLRVEGWFDRVTPDEAFRIAAGIWVLAGLMGMLWQLAPVGRASFRRSFVALLALWVIVSSVAWTVEARARRVDEAVVLDRESKVRNGPGESFDTAFVLHEGAEVVVEAERGTWTEISLPGDLRGWISSDSIGRL